jgi:uracil phosphoribosyltransferase
MLNYFDKADNAFISAYRKHHKNGTFDIRLEYVSCPSLDDRVLILSDPMLATGASIVTTVNELMSQGTPKQIIIVAVIASREGLSYVQRNLPKATIWTAAIDEELTAKAYIVPGLGDAGDLAYGLKQNF